MNVLIEIPEKSDRDISIGISNRSLQEAGLFLGNPEAIRLPYRQAMKLLSVHHNVELLGGRLSVHYQLVIKQIIMSVIR